MAAKRRICVITGSHWTAAMGGAQYQAKCLVEEMVKRDDLEVFYLTRRVDPSYSPTNYRIQQFAGRTGAKRHNLGMVLDVPALYKALSKMRPDVIYQRALRSYTSVAALYAKRNGARMVFHIAHDDDVRPSKLWPSLKSRSISEIERVAGRYGVRQADSIIAQTRRQAQFLEQNYRRNATAVIKNFHPYPEEAIVKTSPVKIVWVANFKPMKRPELFVKLAKDLADRNEARFIMIGRSGNTAYRELRQEMSAISNLEYLGEQPLERVNEVLAGAHVFVNTSVAEGFANTFIQAWMRKVPVVSLSVDTDDAFDNGNVGFYGRTYDGMRDAVATLIRDEQLRRSMGEKSQAYAFAHHSVKNVEALISILLRDGSADVAA